MLWDPEKRKIQDVLIITRYNIAELDQNKDWENRGEEIKN